jgi:hypothetical protein
MIMINYTAFYRGNLQGSAQGLFFVAHQLTVSLLLPYAPRGGLGAGPMNTSGFG